MLTRADPSEPEASITHTTNEFDTQFSLLFFFFSLSPIAAMAAAGGGAGAGAGAIFRRLDWRAYYTKKEEREREGKIVEVLG